MHDAIPETELSRLHKHFAIECDNRAWRISEAMRRSPAEDAEMLDCAHAAAAARDGATHSAHYARAKALGAALGREERSYFDAMFRTIPAVAGE